MARLIRLGGAQPRADYLCWHLLNGASLAPLSLG